MERTFTLVLIFAATCLVVYMLVRRSRDGYSSMYLPDEGLGAPSAGISNCIRRCNYINRNEPNRNVAQRCYTACASVAPVEVGYGIDEWDTGSPETQWT